MAGDELVRRVTIAVLAPAFGEHVFFLALQYREPPDFLEIMGEAGFGFKDRHGRHGGHDQALQLVSKQNYQQRFGCQVDFETLLYPKRQSCQRAKRRNSCCWWAGSCKPRAMAANSALPSGWRCASSPARTRSPGPRRHSRNFKRRPVAPHRKPLGRLRQLGTWSDSDPRRTGEASACD